VQIEGLGPDSEVFVNDEPRRSEAGDALLRFELSGGASSVRIKVLEKGQPRCSATFQTFSSREIAWRGLTCEISTTQFGWAVEEYSGPRAQGAVIREFVPPTFILGTDRNADLIGAKLGQIVCIPAEAPPIDWQPVWIIEHGRKRRAVFCGGDAAKCAPSMDPEADRRRAREWKRVLWFERKNLTGPTRGAPAALWARYREMAKNA